MSVPTKAIINQLMSHAAASGHFESVNGHEIKNAVTSGLVAAVWVEAIGPAAQNSSLISTTTRYVINVRIYTPMVQEPVDYIEPAVMDATDTLMTAYSANFTLGGLVRNVVLLADETGEGLNARAGYVSIGQTMQRVMEITVPMIINDSWTQGA